VPRGAQGRVGTRHAFGRVGMTDSNEIIVTFPGGKRVDAQLGAHVLRTDQPRAQGGEDAAPAPFDLFLASLGTCAGIYVLGFCQARGIPTEGIRLIQHAVYDDATHLPKAIDIAIDLPDDFPEKYVAAVRNAANGCKVKKTLAAPPTIEVTATVRSHAAE
jgi:ribosomal protein S12 methylthiotransferase accessory factor